MKRDLYRKLIDWKRSRQRKPLILRGTRQVGKTFLLKFFGGKEFPQFHYLNFEKDDRLSRIFDRDLNPKRIANDLQLLINRKFALEADLLIFDEIQHCPRALTALKYFCEEMPQLALCSAGSLLGVKLGRDSFPVGKVSFLDLFPMTFVEFLEGIGEDHLRNTLSDVGTENPFPGVAHERLWELWKWYLITGGLPEAVREFADQKDNLFEAFQRVRALQRDILDMYSADIAKHAGTVNALHVERLLKNVPAQMARTLDGTVPKFRFKDAVPGFRGYRELSGPLDWLESTGLLKRTSIVEKAQVPLAGFRVENRFKLYLFDVGILHALMDVSPRVILDYDFGTYKGYSAENFVAQELIAAGFRELYCWQGRTSEVDFLIESSGGVLPVEVKSGHVTQSKSLRVFEQKYAPSQSVVVSARNLHVGSKRYRFPLYSAGVLLPLLARGESLQ